MEVFETRIVDEFEIKIFFEDINPRKFFDNLGKFQVWMDYYGEELTPDKLDYKYVLQLLAVLSGENADKYIHQIENDEKDVIFLEKKAKEKNIILPVYFRPGFKEFSTDTQLHEDSWNSFQVGYIYVTNNKVKETFGVTKIDKKLQEKVEDILNFEIEQFNQYLKGESYRFEINFKNEIISNRLGFYSSQEVEEEIYNELDSLRKSLICEK